MYCALLIQNTYIQNKQENVYVVFICFINFQLVEEDMRNLLFGDYMNPDLEDDERLYAEVPSIETFAQVTELCLDEYNQTHKNRMNLVIFR